MAAIDIRKNNNQSHSQWRTILHCTRYTKPWRSRVQCGVRCGGESRRRERTVPVYLSHVTESNEGHRAVWLWRLHVLPTPPPSVRSPLLHMLVTNHDSCIYTLCNSQMGVLNSHASIYSRFTLLLTNYLLPILREIHRFRPTWFSRLCLYSPMVSADEVQSNTTTARRTLIANVRRRTTSDVYRKYACACVMYHLIRSFS